MGDRSYVNERLTREECLEINKGKVVGNVGTRFTVTSGAEVEVVKYVNSSKVSIRFESGQEVVVRAHHLRKGSVKDVFARSVFGAGYLGGYDYGKKSHESAYVSWYEMLRRTHCPKYRALYPTYTDVTVYEGWYNFQTFIKWWYEQPNAGNEGYQLDKDLINEGAKQYNPENCSFVPQEVNKMLNDHGTARGNFPIGVTRKGSGYQVEINKFGKNQYLGYRAHLDEAAEMYRQAKSEYVREVTNNLKDGEVVPEVKVGLLRWADNLLTQGETND